MYLFSFGTKVKLLLLLSLTALINTLAAQETPKPKVFRPDIPGLLLIDFGALGTKGAPTEFKKGWFGSHSINVYYYFPFRVGQSKFTINTGMGLGMDRFKFTKYFYLADTGALDKRYALVPNFLDFNNDKKTDSITFRGIKKSLLSMNYFDVPLELRFNFNPDDLARTFWISVGARAGMLLNANTKIKQKDHGEKVMHKDRYRQGLNQFRYGISLRMGVGNFNWYAFYNLSPLFQKDKGPSATQMNTFTLGISLTGL